MDHSNDQLVIVLNIFDGINFHRTKNTPVIINASLDRNVLETSTRLPGIAATSFESNLVWETDRHSVKRMKTENIPIKIECYALETNDTRSLIGHVLLPLRSVPLLAAGKVGTVKPRWYRLIGLASAEWKGQKPELQLLAMITGREYLNPVKKKESRDSDKEADRSLVIFTNPEPARLESQEDLPVVLLEERGLLQVGCFEQENDLFLVKIVLKYAKQLGKLMPEAGEGVAAHFKLRYELLGDCYPCAMESRPNERFFIHEKIVINFRTSLRSLKRYFQEMFSIRLEILYGNQVIGRLCLKFGDLVDAKMLETSAENIETIEAEKYYRIESVTEEKQDKLIMDNTSEQSSSSYPALKCRFTLKYLSTDRPVEQPVEEITMQHPEKDSDPPPQQLPDVPSVPSINLARVPQAPPSELAAEKIDIQSILHCEDRDLRDVPRTFSYNLLLQSIRFNARPSCGLWQLSLYHPKADTPLTKHTIELSGIQSDTLEFPNLQLSLYFSALPDHVLETITAERSKLSLHGPHDLSGFARIDNQSLVVGTKENQPGVVILESASGEHVGMASIFCFLDEVGVNYNSRQPGDGVPRMTTATTNRPMLDDQMSYKMLEEQKQWMLKQRELFMAELKRKEAAHLMKLSNEWKRRRAKDNAELTQKLEHASALTAALEETKKNLAAQSAQRIQKDCQLEEVKTKLELQYQQQLSEIRDRTSRLEADLAHRSKLQELRVRELEASNDSLMRDSEQLRQDNERLMKQIEGARKGVEDGKLLKAQVAGLEQRLRDSEQSKLFYKQQWAKMIRQVHKMKLENEDELEEMLQQKLKRKERSHLFSERSGCCKQSARNNEQEELDKIHHMIFEERMRQRFDCCSAD